MRLVKTGTNSFLLLEEKTLTPRNLSATLAVTGLRTIENRFARLLKRRIEEVLGTALDTADPKQIDSALDALDDELNDVATNLVTQAYTAGMVEEGGRLGSSDRTAINQILNLPTGMTPAIENFTESMRLELEQAIRQEQASPGFSLPNLVERLRRIKDQETWKLERIARSETTRVASAAREAQWRKVADPNKREYYWVRARDERTCPICRALSARNPWTLEELRRESNGYLPHPNCRCTIARRPFG